MATRIAHLLKNLDPLVWRSQPLPCYPEVSNHASHSEHGFIYYRGLYYKSADRKYPYVCLVNTSDVPMVRCCTESEYIQFLFDYRGGVYDQYDIAPEISVKFKENRAEL